MAEIEQPDQLSKLLDVKITSLADGDVPVWNASTKKWKNGPGGGSVAGAGQMARCSLASPTGGGSLSTLSWGDSAFASTPFDTFTYTDADGSAPVSLAWLTASGTILEITEAGMYLLSATVGNSGAYSASMKGVHFALAGDQSGATQDRFCAVSSTGTWAVSASAPASMAAGNVPSPVGFTFVGVGTNFGVTNYAPELTIIKLS